MPIADELVLRIDADLKPLEGALLRATARIRRFAGAAERELGAIERRARAVGEFASSDRGTFASLASAGGSRAAASGLSRATSQQAYLQLNPHVARALVRLATSIGSSVFYDLFVKGAPDLLERVVPEGAARDRPRMVGSRAVEFFAEARVNEELAKHAFGSRKLELEERAEAAAAFGKRIQEQLESAAGQLAVKMRGLLGTGIQANLFEGTNQGTASAQEFEALTAPLRRVLDAIQSGESFDTENFRQAANVLYEAAADPRFAQTLADHFGPLLRVLEGIEISEERYLSPDLRRRVELSLPLPEGQTKAPSSGGTGGSNDGFDDDPSEHAVCPSPPVLPKQFEVPSSADNGGTNDNSGGVTVDDMRDQNGAVRDGESAMDDLALAYQQAGERAAEFNALIAQSARETADLSGAARELGFTFASALEDAIVKGERFSDILEGLEQDILRILTRKLITEPLAGGITGGLNSLGGLGGGSSGGGLSSLISSGIGALGSLFSGGLGGGPITPGAASVGAGFVPGPHLSTGGPVFGPGGPLGDRIPAFLSDGEFVVSARAAGRHRGLLEAINNDRLMGLAGRRRDLPQLSDFDGTRGRRPEPTKVVHINPSININGVQNPQQFRASLPQIRSALAEQLDRARRRDM